MVSRLGLPAPPAARSSGHTGSSAEEIGMYLVFAVLIIMVIAAGMIVALRRPDTGLAASPTPDGPSAAVPSGRPLGADDLRRARFAIVFRGYRPAEVDALLDALTAQLESNSVPAEVATVIPHVASTAVPPAESDGPGRSPHTPKADRS